MLQKYFWVFLVAAVFFIGLYNFQTSPGFWFDEGIMAQAAKNIAREGIYGIQTAPNVFYTNNFWITTGYPVVFPTALFLKIFGVSVWAARMAPFIYLLAFTAVSYFFIKKLYGFWPSVFSGLLLITFPPFYGNGKAFLGEVPGLFWLVLGLLLWVLFEEKRDKKFLAGSALAFGLCVATKPYFVLIIPGIAFLVLFSLLKHKNLNFKQLLAFGALFSIPVLVWALFAFDISSPQSFQSTFSYFLNSYGADAFEPLKNLFRFVSESTPIHFSVLALTALAALFVSLKQKKDFNPIAVSLLIFSAIVFLWYLKTPGWYRYFFPAHIVVMLLFPASLYLILHRTFASAVLISAVIFQAVFLYTNYNDFYGDSALKFAVWAKQNIPAPASVLIIDKPEAVFLLENENLYQDIFISRSFNIESGMSGFAEADYLITPGSAGNFPAHRLIEEIADYGIYKKGD